LWPIVYIFVLFLLAIVLSVPSFFEWWPMITPFVYSNFSYNLMGSCIDQCHVNIHVFNYKSFASKNIMYILYIGLIQHLNCHKWKKELTTDKKSTFTQ
jgi:hypothetical protein